jgi:hypothetical protein
MPNDDASFVRVWAEFDDERLESTLFDYLWLAATGPNDHAGRIAQLEVEAERRGRAELIERGAGASHRVRRQEFGVASEHFIGTP